MRQAAHSYARVLTCQDEYEVARLYANPAFREGMEAAFDADYRAAEIDGKNEFPRRALGGIGALWQLGVTVPGEYGGAGTGYLAHVVAVEEIARAWASVAQIKLNGTEEQKMKHLPAPISGASVGGGAKSASTRAGPSIT